MLEKDLTEEQLRILKIISRNNINRFNSILRYDPEQIERMIKKYHLRKPIIEDLNAKGVQINDLQDMMYPEFSQEAYIKAVPILVMWMEKKQLSEDVKTEIARVLIDRPVSKKYAFDTLIEEFRQADPNYKNEWGFETDLFMLLGNAFLRWTDDEHAEIIFDLLKENKYKGGNLLITSLSNFKKPENKQKAKDILINELQKSKLDYNQLASIILTLRKLKTVEAKDLISKYVKHEDYDVRNEAKKAIEKFDNLNKS